MNKCQHCHHQGYFPCCICDDCCRELTIDEIEEQLINADDLGKEFVYNEEVEELLGLYRIHFELTRSTTKSE